jgi:hypothetical protein
MSKRNVVNAVGRAIAALDDAAFSYQGQDRADKDAARALLWAILERHGYELAEMGSPRVARVGR